MKKGKKLSQREQEIRKAMEDVLVETDYIEAYRWHMKDPLGFIQTHSPVLAACLMMFSMDRQEKVIRTLRWHSWMMLILTIVLIIGMTVQIVFSLVCR